MRIDQFLAQRGYADSRTKAAALLSAGAVRVDGTVIRKPSYDIDPDVPHDVAVSGDCPYVGRGGLKLEAALDRFGLDVRGMHALDVGASTGGFTSCLLERGAAFVCAVDCGTGQLHPTLRTDPRVRSLENCNARYLTGDAVGFEPDLIVMDVSFISQTLILPALFPILKEGGRLISLIKPQFECGRAALNRKGLVRDPKDRAAAVDKVTECCRTLGFRVEGTTDSPIPGGDGNLEYLLYAVKPAAEAEK